MVKKVIIVSFLTVALCFSLPANEPAAKPKPQVGAPDQIVTTTELHPSNENSNKPALPSADVVNTHLEPSSNNITNSNETAKPVTPKTETPVVTTPNATATSTEKTETTVALTTTTVVPPSKPTSTTKAPTTHVVPITTDKPTNATTAKPISTTAVPVTAASTARGFDGPSFIGGIILTLGLIACGFVGFKYYRTQTERNYHTL